MTTKKRRLKNRNACRTYGWCYRYYSPWVWNDIRYSLCSVSPSSYSYNFSFKPWPSR